MWLCLVMSIQISQVFVGKLYITINSRAKTHALNFITTHTDSMFKQIYYQHGNQPAGRPYCGTHLYTVAVQYNKSQQVLANYGNFNWDEWNEGDQFQN